VTDDKRQTDDAGEKCVGIGGIACAVRTDSNNTSGDVFLGMGGNLLSTVTIHRRTFTLGSHSPPAGPGRS